MRAKNFAVLVGASIFALVAAVAAHPHPKLIVVIVVDQMRADYLERFAAYENGGLHFFAAQGANFLNANYDHMPTETCLGHSVVLSGRNPTHTGIVANEWYDRASAKMTYCVGDPNSPLVGDSGPGVSPRNFIGENFADWIQTSYPGARVFSLSLKDRAAITLGGHHAQGVFWFSHDSGNIISSRYYAQQLPAWVNEFNRKHMIDSYAGKQWTPILDASSPAYHTHEVAGKFPHSMPDKAGPGLYEAVYSSPFGDELLEALAETTINANHVGKNSQGVSDLLAIGFSFNDFVGHAFGPDSPEIADEQIRLDRTLGRLVSTLSGRLGSENILWVLSADHGAEPTPEAERELDHNQSARRIPFSDAHRLKSSSTRFLRLTEQYIGSQDKPIRCCTSIRLNWHVTISRLRSLAMPWPHKYAVWPGIDGFYDTAHLDSVPGWIGECLRNRPSRSVAATFTT